MGTSPGPMQVAMSSNPEHNERGVMGSFIGGATAEFFPDQESLLTEASTRDSHGIGTWPALRDATQRGNGPRGLDCIKSTVS